MGLQLIDAKGIIDASIAKAMELDIRICVAVVDAGGRLIAFSRMDGANWAAVYASQGKALTSAAFGKASGELQEKADQPTPRGIASAEGGHMILGKGAVPIFRNGSLVGACGVGGGTGQQDEECAAAGVARADG